MINIQHPEITNAERTGYPSWSKNIEEIVYCGICGYGIKEDEIVYESDNYLCLCDECYEAEMELEKEERENNQ